MNVVYQGCTTYLKAITTNKSGTKVEGHNGSLGAVSHGSRGKALDEGVMGIAPPPKADDSLLIRT